MNRRTAIQMTVAACVSINSGCQLIPHRAGRERRNQLSKADTLVLHEKSSGIHVRLTDAEDIARFLQLYASLKWTAYWHTVPAGLDAKTIQLMSGENRLGRFSLYGDQWDHDSYSHLSTAELSPEQDEWLEGLFRKGVA